MSLYSGTLRGHLGVHQPSVSPDGVSAGFRSQLLSGLLFLALVLCAGEPVWYWDPLLLGGTSAAEKSFLIFNHRHMWVWDQPVLHLCLSSQSRRGFYMSLVIQLLFS